MAKRMRKLFKIKSFVLVILSVTSIQAQEWKKIEPIFEKPGVYNMSLGTFIDEKNGWFTETFAGRTWHSSDGGYQWEIQKDSSAVWSYNIDFNDKFHGWIVGKRILDYQPLLWKTKDGGNHWQEFMIPEELVALTFKDSLNGFSGGVNIYHTTDGGATWHKSSVEPGIHFGIWDIHFPDSQYGWAIGGNANVYDAGIILKSMDGGATWMVNVPVASATGKGVYFTDRLHGVVVGSNPPFFEGVIMRTEDGGDNWEVQYLSCSWLNDVVFTDDSTGWVVGDLGVIWKTEDGGKTWERVKSGTAVDLNRIVFVENGRVGYIFGKKNTLLRYESTSNVVEDKKNAVPMNHRLYPNYPNPFNSETRIEYELAEGGIVYVRIFDLTGKEVVTLEDGRLSSGKHAVKWNGKDKFGQEVSSGVYVINLKTRNSSQARKICLIH